MQGARRNVRSEAFRRNVGRNGQDHDEARHGETPRRRQENGEDARGRSQAVGQGNEAEVGCRKGNVGLTPSIPAPSARRYCAGSASGLPLSTTHVETTAPPSPSGAASRLWTAPRALKK